MGGGIGLLIAGGLWLWLGLASLWYGWPDIRLAFGLTGQPGTAAVEKCVTTGSGKQTRTDCRGWFTPDEPSLSPRYVQLPPESGEGQEFRAQMRPDGEWARPSGTAGRLATLALPAFGLLVLTPVPLVLAFLLGKERRPGKVFVRTTIVLALAATALCVAGMVGAEI
ncbi:hypothetical protein ABGB12_03190 [Actinocorallia sp. B10E7]|uniref:hypothetical protein n=1 Tax=Actinocorallia sp. B10E7 TaxID=3153558 RepID=UPI00325DE088